MYSESASLLVPLRPIKAWRLVESEIVYPERLSQVNDRPQQSNTADFPAKESGRGTESWPSNPRTSKPTPTVNPMQSLSREISVKPEEDMIRRDSTYRSSGSEGAPYLPVSLYDRGSRPLEYPSFVKATSGDYHNNMESVPNPYYYIPESTRKSDYYSAASAPNSHHDPRGLVHNRFYEYKTRPPPQESWNLGSGAREHRALVVRERARSRSRGYPNITRDEADPPLIHRGEREEIRVRERSRPRYREHGEEDVIIRERSEPRYRDDIKEEIIIRGRSRPRYREDIEGDLIVRERSKPRRRSEVEEDIVTVEEEIVIRGRSRPRYREERDGETAARDRPRLRYTEQGHQSTRHRSYSRQRGRRPRSRDETIIRRVTSPTSDLQTRDVRLNDDYGDIDTRMTKHEEASMRPKGRARDPMVSSRDSSPGSPRFYEPSSNHSTRVSSFYGNNHLPNSHPSYDRAPRFYSAKPSHPRRLKSLSSRPKTPGPPPRSATQTSFAHADNYKESASPPASSSFYQGPTNEDVISKTLQRFTTFNSHLGRTRVGIHRSLSRWETFQIQVQRHMR